MHWRQHEVVPEGGLPYFAMVKSGIARENGRFGHPLLEVVERAGAGFSKWAQRGQRSPRTRGRSLRWSHLIKRGVKQALPRIHHSADAWRQGRDSCTQGQRLQGGNAHQGKPLGQSQPFGGTQADAQAGERARPKRDGYGPQLLHMDAGAPQGPIHGWKESLRIKRGACDHGGGAHAVFIDHGHAARLSRGFNAQNHACSVDGARETFNS